MNFYNEIKNKLIDEEIYSASKDYSKEKHKIKTYYEIGKLLNEAGKHYGENIIGEYSKKLVTEVGKKYNKRTLFRMKQYFILFSDEKVSQFATQLTWSHYIELLPVKDIEEIKYYITVCKEQHIGRDDLRKKIKNKEYERLSEDTKLKLINNDETNIVDLIPDPILIKNRNNYDNIREKVLQKIILENIESFMNELGSSFSFIGSEYKIIIGNKPNYIDILLFNYHYNCFVVIELKVTPLKKEHIGQIQVYMNYIDKNVKGANHDKTIGIIVVKENNKYIVEYSSDKRIISRTYELV